MTDGEIVPNPVRALRDWFGERTILRRAFGNPRLTEAKIFCDLMVDHFTREADEQDANKLSGDGEVAAIARNYARDFASIADSFIHGSAAEQGWDTDKSIEAAAAVSPKGMRLEPNGRGGE